MTWRMKARPIIARVLAETRGQPEKEIRRALAASYPFGERRMYPYKAWLSEIRRQRGLEKPKRRGPEQVADEQQQAFCLE